MLKDLFPKFSLCLSPMDDITTDEYRYICKKFGADVLFTEFVSSDALIRDVEKSYAKISFSSYQRPIGIQIFGSTEQSLVQAAQRVERLNPDFIDINWGCPMKKIAGKGAGSGILADIPKMIALTRAVVNAVKLPVSVKTRIAYDEHSTPVTDFCEALQDTGIQLLSIHGRTKQQMYRGDADWDLIGRVKNNPRMQIPVFGNGDITSAQKAMEYKNRYGVDGILIGRAAVGRPYIFAQCKQLLSGSEVTEPTLSQKADICIEHLTLMTQNQGERRALIIMKKFYSKYFSAVDNFKSYKMRLMEADSTPQAVDILQQIKHL
ncbi:MAG: tRNA-dihydrouridine synthase family protein [Bacteroidales bacterium]|nr:tRNA-dihydrouridine synthase family protein [Bacteroidales bacterium]